MATAGDPPRAAGGSATPIKYPATERTWTAHPSAVRSSVSVRASRNTFTMRYRLPSSSRRSAAGAGWSARISSSAAAPGPSSMKTALPPGASAAATVCQKPGSRAGGTCDSRHRLRPRGEHPRPLARTAGQLQHIACDGEFTGGGDDGHQLPQVCPRRVGPVVLGGTGPVVSHLLPQGERRSPPPPPALPLLRGACPVDQIADFGPVLAKCCGSE
ncbi:hypothetical protein [Streptomyces sp. NBC_01506]|uniref:hypothetical protein n=1 Tax=Streptomyces sp. NBC_01506 TaxID=2903887 RepID=UPI003867E878